MVGSSGLGVHSGSGSSCLDAVVLQARSWILPGRGSRNNSAGTAGGHKGTCPVSKTAHVMGFGQVILQEVHQILLLGRVDFGPFAGMGTSWLLYSIHLVVEVVHCSLGIVEAHLAVIYSHGPLL